MLAQKKVVVVGAGPVGALAALYATKRGYQVELYDLRDGNFRLTTIEISCSYQKHRSKL